jgi:hypothetical protein
MGIAEILRDQFQEYLAIRYYITFSTSIALSIIKISDKLLSCKKNSKMISSQLSSNLNVEFMCCILYGMTNIFKNEDSMEKKTDKKTKVHVINYLNTIDTSEKGGFNDIQVDVKVKGLFDKNDEENLINTTEKSNISDTGDENNSKITGGEDALITEFLPAMFSELRRKDEISDRDLYLAFKPSKNKSAIEKMSESKGKSGSFFFYSHDRKFIIKTISNGERKTLLNVINDYCEYMDKHNSTSITKIYGLYNVVIHSASSVNVILMQNLFGCNPRLIKRMFDLKGSTVGRKTKDVQNWKNDQVLKDLDYEWVIKIERNLIKFNNEDIAELKSLVSEDVDFLKGLQLMDYSLLTIIIDFPTDPNNPDYKQIMRLLDERKFKGHIYKSRNKNYLYIIGIIDYLQKFNCRKSIEHTLKGIYYGKNKNMVSCIPPDLYGKRFFNFMKEKVFVYGGQ